MSQSGAVSMAKLGMPDSEASVDPPGDRIAELGSSAGIYAFTRPQEGDMRMVMKKVLILLIFLLSFNPAPASTNAPPQVGGTNTPVIFMVQLDGEKWYTPKDLAEIVRTDAKRKKVIFNFESSECGIDVRTSGSNDVVRVVYSKGLGQPAYTAFLNRKGLVTTNYVITPFCGYGDKK